MWRAALSGPILIGTVCVAGEARAAGPWYVSGSVGAYFREQASGTETFRIGGLQGPGETVETFRPGIIANLALGYKLPAHFRIEAELGYAHYDSQDLRLSSGFPAFNGDFAPRSGGDRSRYTGTMNLFYDLPRIAGVVPYIGGGLGGAHHEAARGLYSNGTTTFTNRFATNVTTGLGLVEGGISINLSDHLAVVPAYRYMRYFGVEFANGNEIAHIAKLGLRYSF